MPGLFFMCSMAASRMMAPLRPGGAACAALVRVCSISSPLIVVWASAGPVQRKTSDKAIASDPGRGAIGFAFPFFRRKASVPAGIGQRLLAVGADDLLGGVEAHEVMPVAGRNAAAMAFG